MFKLTPVRGIIAISITALLWVSLITQPAPWVSFQHLPEPIQPFRPIAVALVNELIARLKLEPSFKHPEGIVEFTKWRTGLSNSYEDDKRTFTEGLRRLCDSIEQEAKLTPFGRALIRIQLDLVIENRLKIGSWLQHHASALPDSVTASFNGEFGPVFILGMPRSGSTFLHNLLSLDTRMFRAPRQWEIVDAIPPLGDGDETGLSFAQTLQRRWRMFCNELGTAVFRFLTPNLVGVHPISSTNAEECMPILALDMQTYHFQTIMNVPSYQDWLLDQPDQVAALEWHFRYLKAMNTSKYWLLKAPWHMNHLESIFHVYPKAKVIVTHRDPSSMISSLSSLISRLHGLVSDAVDPKDVGASTLRTWERIVHRFVAQRRRIKEEGRFARQILDLSHTVLSENPMGAVKEVYDFLGLRLLPTTQQSMKDWLDKDVHLGKKGATKKHEYKGEWFGLDESNILSQVVSFREYAQEYLSH